MRNTLEPLIELQGVSRSYQKVRALDDIQLTVSPGEILAILGESGSGKSTLGRIMSRLESPDAGRCILRGKVQMIFQDPFASLNPVHTIGYHVQRALVLHDHPASEAADILESVGLRPGRLFLNKFPFELSGGQRQRVAIARALAVRPALLIADEPTSMLDVSIRMDILNLLQGLRRSHQLAILLITHDLPSAFYLSDRIAVMYAGRIVETGRTQEIRQNPVHPYTQLLWAVAQQRVASRFEDKTAASGEGCAFASRCPEVHWKCRRAVPPLIGKGSRAVRCFNREDAP